MKSFLRCCLLLAALGAVAGQEPKEPNTSPAIEGRVFNEDTKDPISGARVRAFEIDYDLNGTRRLAFVPSAEDLTDMDGRYVLYGLPPGQYFIRAENKPFTPLFYPNTTDWRAAAPLVYTGTGLLGIDIALGRRDLHRVSGTVVTAAADPAKGYFVMWLDLVALEGLSHEPTRAMNQAKDMRTFEIDDIQSGPYELTASTRVPNSPGMRGNSGRTRIEVRSEDLKDVEIRLKTAVILKGRITVREDSSSIDLTKLQVWLRARYNGITSRPTDPDSAPAAADGSFAIKDVHDQEYQLMGILNLPESAYIQEATLDGSDALHSWITVPSESSFLDITVDAKGGEVSGQVVDGRDRLYDDSATVVLVPVRRLGELNRAGARTVTITSGSVFRIPGVRPGEYRLLAWRKLKGGAYLNAEFMSDYERKGTVVRVGRDSRIILNAPVVDLP